MKSRAFVFLGLLLAVLLLVSSVVAEEKKDVEAKELNQQHGGGRPCSVGCCGYGPYGRCSWCCRNVDEARAFDKGYREGAWGGGGYGGGGYGGWGGGRGGYGGWGGGRGGWGGGRCCGEDDGDAQSKENEAKKP